MATDSIGTCLLCVGRKQPGGRLMAKFRACRSDSQNSESRYDSNDRNSYEHLRICESLLIGYGASAFHLRPPDKLGWSRVGNNCSVRDEAGIGHLLESLTTSLLPLVTGLGKQFPPFVSFVLFRGSILRDTVRADGRYPTCRR